MFDDWQSILLIGGFTLLILTTILFTVLYFSKKKKIKKEFPELLEALGGKDNLDKIEQNGSRISLFVANKKSIDKEKIKENGVSTIVVTSKKITLVIGKDSSRIYKYLNEQLN